jgi:hypothetical protein
LGYATRKDQYLTIDDPVSGFMNNIVDLSAAVTGSQDQPDGRLRGALFPSCMPLFIRRSNLITTVTPQLRHGQRVAASGLKW